MAQRPAKRFELPSSRLFPDGWSGTVADLRAMQSMLASQVTLNDEVGHPRWIAGVDVGLGRFGTVARAAAVLMDGDDLKPVAQAVVELPVALPYIPGLLSFRELPAILAALDQLPRLPELILCDGQGIAHPRRFGIAAHLGIVTSLPSIGVAKSILFGQHDPLPAQKGARRALRADNEVIGTVLRSRLGTAPLIISPGHRVSIKRAADLVLAMTTRYRLPEPTRLADRLSKSPRD